MNAREQITKAHLEFFPWYIYQSYNLSAELQWLQFWPINMFYLEFGHFLIFQENTGQYFALNKIIKNYDSKIFYSFRSNMRSNHVRLKSYILFIIHLLVMKSFVNIHVFFSLLFRLSSPTFFVGSYNF